MNEEYTYKICKSCNGSGRESGTITGGCPWCNHPLITNARPGYRRVNNPNKQIGIYNTTE